MAADTGSIQDGTFQLGERGTPHGGVISPLLANLFLHYAFHAWMRWTHPANAFERYADDVICHCRSEKEARRLLEALQERFASYGLQLHPQKPQIVYFRDGIRRAPYPVIQFTFLGYAFRPRIARSVRGGIFTNFSPAVSPQALKRLRQRVRAT